MHTDYSLLLDDTVEDVAETKHGYHLITERHVQVMWLEQKYFNSLKTLEGDTIEVLSPGIWNSEAGPDFKKAHLLIGDKELFGDVEIHLSDEGWMQHNHHTDANYNQVILHLSFWKARKPGNIITFAGRKIHQAYFEDALTISEKRIMAHIDLDLYPYQRFSGAGRCADTLFRKMKQQEMEMLFHNAAEWRLKKKREHIHVRVDDPRLYLASGLAMALGYKNNSEAFLDLFHLLHQQRHHLGHEGLLALALGCCGFFSEHYQELWGASPFYCKLRETYLQQPDIIHRKIPLVLSNVRPLNHPVRRIAYLALMVKDPTLPQLYQRLEAHWEASWPTLKNKKDYKIFLDELIAMLPTYHDPFWSYRYTFEVEPKKEALPLVGKTLKTEALLNTLLPFLHESILSRSIPKELDAFAKLFAAITPQKTGKAKYLRHRFFGDSSKGSILARANTLQGAYQLHHDFCIHYEASCEGCPFVERYCNNHVRRIR